MELIYWQDLHLVWVSDFYDMPLNGICRHNGALCEFDGDYETGTYVIKSLAWWEKARWIVRKKLFEVCVGTHWTYGPDGSERGNFHYRSAVHRLLFKLYYAPKKIRWYLTRRFK